MRNTIQYLDKTFEKQDILSASMAVDTSLNQRSLDVDTMQAVVKSDAALTSFEQNTPVRFLRGGSQYALWYLMEITRIGPKPHSLSMMSSLGRLTQMEHRGGVYNGVAASVVIDEICGVVPHFVQDAFRNVRLYGWLPYVAPSGENGAQTGSAKDNLLKVLFALNATVRDDAEGTLRIENLSTAVSSSIGPDRIYRENANVIYEPTVTAVTVLEHQFIGGGDETTLFEGTTVDGQVIVFREPMSDLAATGFTIRESNANYAVVSAGSGTLTGRAYIHTTREITKPVAEAAIPNVARIEGATLVSVTNSADVVNRLVDYYKHRTYINVDATIDFEDAGDVVELWDPFDKVMRQACIEKISPLVVSQTMKGRISALGGFTPWQVVPFEDTRELLTGSGTWTAPEGVTEVTAVLIGGGQGGMAGNAGSAAPAPTKSSSETRRYSEVTEYLIGFLADEMRPGNGGLPGAPGNGGRIFRVSLSVIAGQSLAYSCGEGGAGAPSGSSDEGFAGGNTVLEQYSSANGSSSDTGYTDATTGERYAANGVEGVAGSDGDSPNSTATSIDGYIAGARGSAYSTSGGNYNIGYGYFLAYANGGYGGGAAFGANGGNGKNASSNNVHISWNTPPDSAYARVVGGGDGANAQPPSIASGYGTGGTGGNGGGGAGAYGYPTYVSNNVGTAASKGNISVIRDTGYAGFGGAGSEGGAGAPGCIILYYRKPVTE